MLRVRDQDWSYVSVRVLGLQWQDIDFERVDLHVNRQWTRHGMFGPAEDGCGLPPHPTLRRSGCLPARTSQEGAGKLVAPPIWSSRLGQSGLHCRIATFRAARLRSRCRAGWNRRRLASTRYGTPSPSRMIFRGIVADSPRPPHGPRVQHHHGAPLHPPLPSGSNRHQREAWAVARVVRCPLFRVSLCQSCAKG